MNPPDAVASSVGAPRHDQEARLLRRVTEACNEATATEELFARCVRDIGDTMGWGHGRVAQPDDPFAPAEAVVVDGLPEHVRVPVSAENAIAAVLEFDPPRPVPPDEDLVDLLTNLGQQLGSVIERERILARLDEQSRNLERSNAELERFAYVASHDLQEPLRKIVGFSELLEDGYRDALDETGREYLEYVTDGARRMQHLIKDLLAFSRAGRAVPEIERIELDELVGQVLEVMEWTLSEAGAEVDVDDLPAVMADSNQLAQVLTNLLSNAVKYARPGGAHIRVSAQPTGDGMWEIVVADDGIGIPEEFREQIFEVFRRLHAQVEYPGTGIGLAITRRFVEAQGGRIWVTDSPPQGTAFHVTLPAAEEVTE